MIWNDSGSRLDIVFIWFHDPGSHLDVVLLEEAAVLDFDTVLLLLLLISSPFT